MTDDFDAAMRHATHLTRSGDLAGATRAIQAALGGQPAPPTRPPLRRIGRSLAVVVRDLRAARGPAAAADVASPDDARVLHRTATGPAGSRAYRLYIPATPPRGLVVLLHGCTQSPDDFAHGTGMNAIADAQGLAVAYPAQTAAHNPSGCWNWFSAADQRRGQGEPAILATLTESLMAEFGLGRDQVFIAGLSAGGAMAAIMAQAYPDLCGAVGIHSGLAAGAAHDMGSAFAAMRGAPGAGMIPDPAAPPMRTIIFHGTADATVAPVNAARIVDSVGAGFAEKRLPTHDAGGRATTRRVLTSHDGQAEVEEWLIGGAGHAWSGGQAGGSFTDPRGPDASAEMVRFFLRGDLR